MGQCTKEYPCFIFKVLPGVVLDFLTACCLICIGQRALYLLQAPQKHLHAGTKAQSSLTIVFVDAIESIYKDVFAPVSSRRLHSSSEDKSISILCGCTICQGFPETWITPDQLYGPILCLTHSTNFPDPKLK